MDKRKQKGSPKTEREFEEFLIQLSEKVNVDYEKQKTIDGCPFVRRGKHKVDFVLTTAESSTLYVEVKGWMSYRSVNELKYLLEYSGKNFYILQVTNEDWMGLHLPKVHGRVAAKIQKNRDRQYQEIKEFFQGELSASEMSNRSKKRLADFKCVREGDILRWLAEKKRQEEAAKSVGRKKK